MIISASPEGVGVNEFIMPGFFIGYRQRLYDVWKKPIRFLKPYRFDC